MLNKKLLYLAGFFVVLLVLSAIVRNAVLGQSKTVILSSAPPLTGQVAQTMGTTQNSELPVPGKDFTLKHVRYFQRRTLAVAQLKPLHGQFDDSYVIMKRKRGVYQVILGPGSAFRRSTLQSLPEAAIHYLDQQGAVL
jgi:hypothetical protein